MRALALVSLMCGLGSASATSSVQQPQQAHRALEGHQVIRIHGEKLGATLTEMENALPGLDVLHRDSGDQVRVRVAAEHIAALTTMLDKAHLRYVVEIKNLADYIRKQELQESLKPSSRIEETCDEKGCSKPPKTSYMTFSQMELYMKELAANNPSRVKLSSIGKSVEGRDIWMVHVLPSEPIPGGRRDALPISVWIEGGLHAREWISSSSSLHLLHKIATACDTYCYVNYYFVPMANPDGYEYSRTSNRMWRKNRSIAASTNCPGVDLNRNWDYKFGVGASSDPCSETFKGPYAFSEPETQSISKAMKQVENLQLMITFHSFGQSVLYPWGWTSTPVADKDLLVRAGNAFAAAVKAATGKVYKVVNSADGLYYASGATDDWAKERLDVPYTFTIELRDQGANGFLLPASQIEPTAREVIVGVSALISQMRTVKN